MFSSSVALTIIWFATAQLAPTAVDVLQPWPFVPGSGTGLTMLGQDPGAAALSETAGLVLRHRWSPLPAGNHQDWALLGSLPLGSLRLAAGMAQNIRYQKPMPTVDPARSLLQLGWQFGEQGGLAWAYQRDLVERGRDFASQMTLGWYQQWLEWLSSSIAIAQLECRGADACQRAQLATTTLPTPRIGRFHLGLGLRPIAGSSWLTLAAAGQVDAYPGNAWRNRQLSSSLLVQPSPGLQLQASAQYDLASRQPRWWLGATVPLLPNFTVTGGGGMQGSFAAFRWQAHQAPLIAARQDRQVTLVLGGSTLIAGTMPWQGSLPISRLAWDLALLAQDKEVAEVCLDIVEPLQISWALAQELRAAVQRLVAQGKQVKAHLRRAEEMTYIVASGAQKIVMDLAGGLELDGFAMQDLYLATALEKLGVQMEAITVGQFKSAPDMFVRSGPREEMTPVEQALLAQADQLLLETLALRHLDKQQQLLLEHGIFTPQQAFAAGLIDAVTDLPQAIEQIAQRSKESTWQVPQDAWLGQEGRTWSAVPAIVVVPIVGTLRSSSANPGMPWSQGANGNLDYVASLQRLAADPGVKAVVLRIDSPGGDVDVAEDVWRMVRFLAQHKPVLASLGGVAASGGYYIASAANTIVAEPSTITGSIGIFMLKPNAALLLERLGIGVQQHQGQGQPDPHSWLTPWSPTQQARYQGYLKFLYQQFIARVATGRGLSEQHVAQYAEGRVWTGAAAKEAQLVDHLGGLVDTIEFAKQAAGLSEQANVAVRFQHYPRDLLGFLAGWSSGGQTASEQLVQQLLPLLQNEQHPWLAMAPYAHWITKPGE